MDPVVTFVGEVRVLVRIKLFQNGVVSVPYVTIVCGSSKRLQPHR